MSVYGHAGVTKLNKIQFLQNQLLKVLSNKKFRHSTAENQMIHFLFLIIFQIFFNDLEFWIIYSFFDHLKIFDSFKNLKFLISENLIFENL